MPFKAIMLIKNNTLVVVDHLFIYGFLYTITILGVLKMEP